MLFDKAPAEPQFVCNWNLFQMFRTFATYDEGKLNSHAFSHVRCLESFYCVRIQIAGFPLPERMRD